MKVRTTMAEYYGSELAETINRIGYENILQILPCYHGMGNCSFMIIYKDAKETEKSQGGNNV